MLIYNSGVMVDHNNILHNLSLIPQRLMPGEEIITVSWCPQYHDMGLIGNFIGTVGHGGSIFMMSPITFIKKPHLWVQQMSARRYVCAT
jgi:acyl-CoA synthetase (AMP-forming)/AMP-acid ligase II